jgi:hypothetical protein
MKRVPSVVQAWQQFKRDIEEAKRHAQRASNGTSLGYTVKNLRELADSHDYNLTRWSDYEVIGIYNACTEDDRDIEFLSILAELTP